MLKKTILSLVATIFITCEINAEWIPLKTDKAPNSIPAVSLLSDDNTSTIIKIDIAGFNSSSECLLLFCSFILSNFPKLIRIGYYY